MYRFDGYTVQSVLHKFENQVIEAKAHDDIHLVISIDHPGDNDIQLGVKVGKIFIVRQSMNFTPVIVKIENQSWKAKDIIQISIFDVKSHKQTIIYLTMKIVEISGLETVMSPMPGE